MGFRDPTTINNTGAVGSATNPLTGTALTLDRENQYSILRLKGTQDREILSILDGAITPTRSEIIVDTEGSASADDLTTISLTSNGLTTLHSGMRLSLRSADDTRVVTVKNGTGVNGITTYGGTDIVLSTNWDLELKLIDGLWVEQRNRAEYKADVAKITADNAAAAASTPATTTARGIGRVATSADLVDGAPISNGPAFLAAGSEAVTTTPTPNTIMCRDEAGRVRVEDPVHDKDVVNKVYVDSVINIGSNGAYGLKWNQETDVYQKLGATNRTQIQKNMKRCVLNSDGTVNYYLDPFNSALKADGTTAILTGADGNVMVEVPKFWYKHELNGNEHQWWVSPTSLAGYNVHPWFLEGGVEHDFRYYRAYTCINQGSVLRSVSGVTPTKNQTRNTFRAQARTNGAGWNLCSWNAVNAIQILYLTEYCTLNSQSVLGSGNDTGDDYGITTGQSNVIGNASSGPLNNNTWMSYRGIENFYADCWEFVDGINVQNYKVFLNQNPDTFADDVFTGDYKDSGVTVPAASASYVKKISGNFLPTALGGSSSTYVTDGFWSNTGNRIALFGGGANDGALAGAFCLSVSSAASGVQVDVGAGLSR